MDEQEGGTEAEDRSSRFLLCRHAGKAEPALAGASSAAAGDGDLPSAPEKGTAASGEATTTRHPVGVSTTTGSEGKRRGFPGFMASTGISLPRGARTNTSKRAEA